MTLFLSISVIALWALVLGLAFAVFALARQIGLLHERVAPAGALQMNSALKVGDAAPTVAAETLAGRGLIVGEARRSKSLLVFFLAPDCPICKSLLPTIAASERDEADWVDVLYASDGAAAEHTEFASAEGLPLDAYVVSEELGRKYGVAKLPYAVLLDPAGRIASMGLVNSREHVESLFHAKESGIISIQDYVQKQSA
ncbi:MAG: redoxin domain-containing protein [Pseudomonadota bacterium]